MKAAIKTHPGKLRTINEDVIESGHFILPNHIGETCSLHYMGICDGMGGAKAGETASRLAIITAFDYLKAMPFWPRLASDVREELIKGIIAAHENIVMLSGFDYEKDGMATTIVLLVTDGDNTHVAWCGDSRAYLLSSAYTGLNKYGTEDLVLLTKDHSVIWQNVENGLLTPDQAKNHPAGQELTQSLGTNTYPQPEAITVTVNPGDRYLLCSDGLTLHLNMSDIRKIIREEPDPEVAIERLSDEIMIKGAKDNFSIGILDCNTAVQPQIYTQPKAKRITKPWIAIAAVGGLCLGMILFSEWDRFTNESAGSQQVSYMDEDPDQNSEPLKPDAMSNTGASPFASAVHDQLPATGPTDATPPNDMYSEEYNKLKNSLQALVLDIQDKQRQIEAQYPNPEIRIQAYLIKLTILQYKIRTKLSTMKKSEIPDHRVFLDEARSDFVRIHQEYESQ